MRACRPRTSTGPGAACPGTASRLCIRLRPLVVTRLGQVRRCCCGPPHAACVRGPTGMHRRCLPRRQPAPSMFPTAGSLPHQSPTLLALGAGPAGVPAQHLLALWEQRAAHTSARRPRAPGAAGLLQPPLAREGEWVPRNCSRMRAPSAHPAKRERVSVWVCRDSLALLARLSARCSVPLTKHSALRRLRGGSTRCRLHRGSARCCLQGGALVAAKVLLLALKLSQQLHARRGAHASRHNDSLRI